VQINAQSNLQPRETRHLGITPPSDAI